MDDYIRKDFGKLLKRNALQMRRLMKPTDTEVMRVYDMNLFEIPVTVDVYGAYVRITDYSNHGLEQYEIDEICDVSARMLYVEPHKVIYHERKKRQGRQQHDLQSEQSVTCIVRESGLSFTVDLTKRIDTGLFLDHVETRRLIRNMAFGCDVLNLFSYTGAFSVYAASGGAKSVTSVDLSVTYSEWCRQNLVLNGFMGDQFSCVSQDALKFLLDAVRDRKKYHLIILDPPSFSNSRKTDCNFDVQRDHVKFIRIINTLLHENGMLLFSTNLGTFEFEAHQINGYEIREISRAVAAAGFSKKRHSLRSWMLEKRQDVEIPAQDLEPVTLTEELSGEAKEHEVQIAKEEVGIVAEEELDDQEVSEDDPLVLSWDEESDVDEEDAEMLTLNEEAETESSTKTKRKDDENSAQRRFDRRHDSEGGAERPRRTERESRPRSDFSRPRRDDDKRSSEDRRFDRDRPPRRFDDRRDSGRRFDDNRERRPAADGDRRRYGEQQRYDRESPSRRFADDRRPPRSFDDRTRRNYEDDRPKRNYEDDRTPRRFDGDRPPRRFDDDRPRRQFDDDRPRKRFEDDRPARRFDDRRPPRSFDDRPRRSYEDDRTPRRFDGDRPPRRFSDDRPQRRFDDERPKRRFDDDRPVRRFEDSRPPRRFDEDRPRRRDDDERPSRRFDEDRPPRRFNDDRPPRRFDSDRKPAERDGEQGLRRSERKSGPKLYGFDQFKPTRTRGEDERPFWLEDEKPSKKDSD
ncbi:MAG: hypothetical protein GXY60_10965 [Spirochaetales bacterium]|nr:hypothetical protein [Spirochaetales bacterium]